MLICKQLLIVGLIFNFFNVVHSQSYWFGVKGGAAYMSQTWGSGFSGSSGGSANRNPGFGPNLDVFIESGDPENKGSLYASAGYHSRGSAFQFISFYNDFNDRQTFLFRNVGAEIGARRPLFQDGILDPYFTVGIRGEYTLNTNLSNYTQFNSLFYPDDAFVRKWNYGFTIGGGLETTVSEFIKYFFDVSIMPDLSYQYIQPPLFNVRDPWAPNQTVNLELRQARNVSIELKAGIRFLRKVVYEE